MSSSGAGHRFFSGIGDEGLLSRHGQEFPIGLRQNVGPVHLQPIRIAACLLMPGPVAGNLDGIRYLFDGDLGLVHR